MGQGSGGSPAHNPLWPVHHPAAQEQLNRSLTLVKVLQTQFRRTLHASKWAGTSGEVGISRERWFCMRRVHATRYCTSRSLSTKGHCARPCCNTTEFQADPDSLLQKILMSQANAWQTGLPFPCCPLSKEGQEQSSPGEISFIVSPQDQRAGKPLEQRWMCIMDLSMHPPSQFLSSRENLPPFLTREDKQTRNTKKTDEAN